MRTILTLTILLLVPISSAVAGAPAEPYPLTTCIVSGEALGAQGDPVVVEHEGRELRFCRAGHAEAFAQDPAAHLERIDAAIIEDQRPLYALDICLNSGGPLDGMGEPYEFVHGNRLVRLCCEECRASFEEDAAELLADLDEAVVEQQVDAYPLETCASSGQALGSMGEPHDIVLAGRLVRLCCAGCEPAVQANPEAVLRRLDEARADQAAEQTAEPGSEG